MNLTPKKSLNNSSIIENSFFGHSCSSSSSRIMKIQKPFLSKIKYMGKNNSSTTIQTYNSVIGHETKKIKLNKKIHRIISELKDKSTPRKTIHFPSPRTNHSLPSIQIKMASETTQEMIDKYIIGTRSVYRKDLQPAQINRKNFKKLLIRDFGLIREDDVQKEQIERSKMMYYKENEFNEKKKITIKKSISTNDLCRRSLEQYYTHRIINKKERSQSIANEIRELDCGEYQTVKHKNSKCLTKYVNYHNLNRKIKIHNIEKYTYDLESDDIGIKNLTKLKREIKKVSVEAMKYTSKVTPKFIKGKVKPDTIKKYRSLLGLFFGIG